MELWATTSLLLGGLIVVLLLGMPVAFGLAFMALAGLLVAGGPPMLVPAGFRFWSALANYLLSPIPLFILMGAVLATSGIMRRVYDALGAWLDFLPAGIAVVTILANAIFGALCGVSVAAVATFAVLAVPEMLRQGYGKPMAAGVVVGAGGLSIVIPPSVPFIIYAVITEQSVGKLFISGVIPGVLLTVLYIAVILLWVKIAGTKLQTQGNDVLPVTAWGRRMTTLPHLIPMVGLIVLVLGSIYLGICSPTESAALGAAGAIIIAIGYRDLTWRKARSALTEAMRVNAMICFILAAAMLFNHALIVNGVPQWLSTTLTSLRIPPLGIVAAILLSYLVLGCFLDGVSLQVVTVPVFFPVVMALGFDPIWFGVLVVLMVEIGLITPPVGMNLFIAQGVGKEHGIAFDHIVRGAIPFLLVDVTVVALVVAFPAIALWLPGLMK